MNRNTGMRRYTTLAPSPPSKRLPEVPTKRHPLPTGPDQQTVMAVIRRAMRGSDVCCEVCGEVCGEPQYVGGRAWGWSIHHRKGRQGQRTDNTLPNLILVCGASNLDGCHGRIHQSASWSRPLGLSLSRHGSVDPAAEEVCIDRESRWVYLTADGGYADEPRGGLA